MAVKKPKNRSLVRKILSWTSMILILLLIIFVIILYVKREEVGEVIKNKVNSNLHATLDYDKVGIKLKYFPSIGFCLTDLSLIGQSTFEGDTLASLGELDLVLSLRSLLPGSDQLIIEKLNLEDLDLNLYVTKNGISNYNIVKQNTSDRNVKDGGNEGPALKLSGYSIRRSNISYVDLQNDIKFQAMGLDHTGKGNFDRTVFDLITSTQITSMTLFYSGVPYFLNTRIALANSLAVDMASNTYILEETTLSLNKLQVSLDGKAEIPEKGPMKVDLTFSSPQSEFKSLFSAIPHAYTDDFAQLDAGGNFKLNGDLNYVENTFPNFNLYLNVNNGSFKYWGMDYGIHSINLDAKARNTGNEADDTEVNISKFNLLMNDIPLEGTFGLANPISDPLFNISMKGAADLMVISKTLPIADLEQLSGKIDLDIQSAGRYSSIEKENWEKLTLKGRLAFEDLLFKLKDQPLVSSSNIHLNTDLARATLNVLDLMIGESTINGTVELLEPMNAIIPESELKGRISLQSKNLDINELQNFSNSEEDKEFQRDTTSNISTYPKYLDHLDLAFDVNINNLKYLNYNLSNTTASGYYRDQELRIEDLKSTYDESQIKLNGILDNLLHYNYLSETLNGELNISTDKFDLNKFTVTDPSPIPADETDILKKDRAPLVPENLDMVLNVKSQQLKIQRVTLENADARISVSESTAKIDKFKATGLGGRIAFSGSYNTTDPLKPKLDLTYDVQQLGFQATYQQLTTVPVLAPIIKYIEGKYTSRLSMSADLNPDLMPIISTLDADGYVETLEGVISKFPGFEKISELLDIESLENIKLSDTKNWFVVKDGKVSVEPFTIVEKGITMTISGSHGLDQSMDYDIKMRLPYKLIKDKFEEGNSLESLKNQADKIGLDLSRALNVDLLIKMTGKLTDPKLNVKILSDVQKDVKEQVKQVVEEKIDSFKQVGIDKLDTIKKEIKTEIDENKLKAAREIDDQVNSILRNAEKTSDDIRTEAERLASKIREEGNKQAQALIKEAGENPIKKLAAETAARKVREQANKRADQIEAEADKKTEKLLQKANQQADSLRLEKQKILE